MQLYNFKLFIITILIKWLNSFIWSFDGILRGTTNAGQSGPGSNGKEQLLHIPKAPGLEPHHQMQFQIKLQILIGGGGGRILPHCRGEVSIFYNSS